MSVVEKQAPISEEAAKQILQKSQEKKISDCANALNKILEEHGFALEPKITLFQGKFHAELILVPKG